MANLYLVKSDFDRERIGDVIVDLNRILTIRTNKVKEKDFMVYLLIMDYTESDSVKASFKEESRLMTVLKDIIQKMGCNPDLVDDLVVTYRPDEKKEDFKKLLDKIQESL